MKDQKIILHDSDIENIVSTIEVINYECAGNFFLHLLLQEFNLVELPKIYRNKYEIFKKANSLDKRKVRNNTRTRRHGAHFLQQSTITTSREIHPRLDYLELDIRDLKDYSEFLYKMDLNLILQQMKNQRKNNQ